MFIKTQDGWKELVHGSLKPVQVQNPASRPFTQFAARAIGGHNALGAGRCPTCSGEITEFRNAISLKEYGISGMCQKCQDKIFGVD